MLAVILNLCSLTSETFRGSHTATTIFRHLSPHKLEFATDRAGLLYPNLRSQMFVWGEENAGVMRCLLIDVLDAMAEMMKQAAPKGSEQSCVYAAEVLFGTALDLAAAPGLHYRTFKERREALRNTIDLTVAGLAST